MYEILRLKQPARLTVDNTNLQWYPFLKSDLRVPVLPTPAKSAFLATRSPQIVCVTLRSYLHPVLGCRNKLRRTPKLHGCEFIQTSFPFPIRNTSSAIVGFAAPSAVRKACSRPRFCSRKPDGFSTFIPRNTCIHLCQKLFFVSLPVPFHPPDPISKIASSYIFITMFASSAAVRCCKYFNVKHQRL